MCLWNPIRENETLLGYDTSRIHVSILGVALYLEGALVRSVTTQPHNSYSVQKPTVAANRRRRHRRVASGRRRRRRFVSSCRWAFEIGFVYMVVVHGDR